MEGGRGEVIRSQEERGDEVEINDPPGDDSGPERTLNEEVSELLGLNENHECFEGDISNFSKTRILLGKV